MPRSTRREQQSSTAVTVEAVPLVRYAIDFDAMSRSGKDPSFMVAARLCGRCPACAASPGVPAWRKTRDDLMRQISGSCSKEATYLLPGTPVTEAVFRLILQSGNRPLSVHEVQGGLAQVWASVIYLKSLSEDVIKRMLDQPNEYSIGPVEAA